MYKLHSNKIEQFNLVFAYFSTYFYMLFSAWIYDVEINYKLGIFFTNFLILFCVVHAIVIIYDLILQIKRRIKKSKYEKQIEIIKQTQMIKL